MMKLFDRYNIQGKLFFIFGLIALIAAVVVIVNIFTATIMDQSAEKNLIADGLWQEASRAEIWLQEMEKAQAEHLSSGDPDWWYRYVYASQRLEDTLNRMILKSTDQEESALLQNIKNIHKDYVASFNDVLNNAQGHEADLYGDTEAIAELTGYLDEAYISLMYESFGDFFDKKNTESVQVQDNTWVYFLATILISAASVVFFLVVALIAAVLVVTQVIRPMAFFIRAIAAVQANDFNPEMLQNYPQKSDEVGLLMRNFIEMQQAFRQREEAMQKRIDDLRARLHDMEQPRKG